MSRTTTAAVIIALLLLVVAAYLLFGRETSGGVTVDEGPASAAELTFINLAAKIDPVTFGTDILEDPRFKRLQNIRTAIIPEASGRPDPFAPLPAAK